MVRRQLAVNFRREITHQQQVMVGRQFSSRPDHPVLTIKQADAYQLLNVKTRQLLVKGRFRYRPSKPEQANQDIMGLSVLTRR